MTEPDLSIIVAASHAAHTLGECLGSLAPQLSPANAEVLVVTSSAAEASLARAQLPQAAVLEAGGDTLVPILWGMGVQAARGRVLALTIATCIPDSGWIGAILRAHAEYHTAIGGAIENAAGSSLVDWAVYFVRYTPYMLPFASGPMEVPGDNGTYKRAALADQMDWIRDHGFWENDINARLRAEKRSLWGDPRIVVYHKHSFTLAGFSRQRFVHGRIFGRRRAAGSAPRRRILYILSAPAIPGVYLLRIVKRLARKQRHRSQFVLSLPLIVWFLLCWAAGEWFGLIGGGKE